MQVHILPKTVAVLKIIYRSVFDSELLKQGSQKGPFRLSRIKLKIRSFAVLLEDTKVGKVLLTGAYFRTHNDCECALWRKRHWLLGWLEWTMFLIRSIIVAVIHIPDARILQEVLITFSYSQQFEELSTHLFFVKYWRTT